MREIRLHGKHSDKVAFVDDADYDFVKDHKWYFHTISGGVYTIINGKRISMARLIMNPPDDRVVDHINHNRLDNRRVNLRVCTHQQNNMNCRINRDSTSSKYAGVSWHSLYGKWLARIGFNGKIIYLGYFDFEEDAARAYDKAACELFGEYACLNFPREV